MNNCMHRRVRCWLGASLLATLILAGCGGGGGADTSVPPPVNTAPIVGIQFAGIVSTGTSGANATATTGADVVLDASGSSDAEGDTLSYAWSLISKPAGSAYAIGAAAGTKLNLKPDVLGNYVFNLRVTDSKGAFTDKSVTVLADNTPPNAVIVVNVSYSAQPVIQPALNVSVGSGIVLSAAGSTDADGDVVTTTWELIEKPAGSAATLAVTSQTARISPDVLGLYKIRARGADGKGAYAETVYQINASNTPPVNVIYGVVAVISGDTQTVPAGQPVVTSGALSFDERGAALSYAWAVDARPAGSVAVLGAATTAIPSFTPDVAGAYVLSLTVNNGRQTSVAYLKLDVFIPSSSVMQLPFKPLDTRYSLITDRLVVLTGAPDALKVVNPFDGTFTTIALPAPVSAFNLSPDGKLAGVLHENSVSLVDLESGTLLRTSSTGRGRTEVFPMNNGALFLVGTVGSTPAISGIVALNGRTGQALPVSTVDGAYNGYQRGIFMASKNKAIFTYGVTSLTASSFAYFTINPTSDAIVGYPGSAAKDGAASPLFLSAKEDVLFSGNGIYYQADTLQYMGRFILDTSTGIRDVSYVQSVSSSPVKPEVLMMSGVRNSGSPNYDYLYFSSYKKYSGDLLLPDGRVTLPTIGGNISYGIGIFYTAAGDTVKLVQTGSEWKNSTSAKYYLIYH